MNKWERKHGQTLIIAQTSPYFYLGNKKVVRISNEIRKYETTVVNPLIRASMPAIARGTGSRHKKE